LKKKGRENSYILVLNWEQDKAMRIWGKKWLWLEFAIHLLDFIFTNGWCAKLAVRTTWCTLATFEWLWTLVRVGVAKHILAQELAALVVERRHYGILHEEKEE
jgi:hypothetical protein